MIKNLREKIILATIELGAKKGIESISIKDIGDKCKVSSAAMYYHFKNKYELLFEAAFFVVKEITDCICKNAEPSAECEKQYKETMKVIADYHIANPTKSIFYTRMLVVPSMELSKGDLSKIRDYCPLTQNLRLWQQQDKICDMPQIMSVAYYPLCIYLLHNFINKIKPTEQSVNSIIDHLWYMISKKQAVTVNS